MSKDYRKNDNGYTKQPLSFAVGRPMVDYLRLSTWDYQVYRHFVGIFHDKVKSSGIQSHDAKWLNYEGEEIAAFGGTLFVGVGQQKGKEAYLIQASSEAAHHMLTPYGYCLDMGWQVACTRIDPQITVEQPPSWEQFDFLCHVRDETRFLGEWKESPSETGGLLCTVYIGSRTSDNYARLYQKATRSKGVYLRFEMEIKGQRAKIAGPSIARNREMIGDLLLGKLVSINYPPLTALLHMPLHTYSPDTIKIERVFEEDKTRSWLLGSVLPAFGRYINSHGADPFVREQFYNAIEWSLRGEWDND